MSTICNHEYCTGCGACYNICPTRAIKMIKNREGFLHPQIDNKLCINCGLCKKTCPINNPQYNNYSQPKCIAAAANDEQRKNSSSGAIFPLLAEKILENKGYVCGAAFSHNKLEHIIIDSKEQLEKLKGSKYLQSNISHLYKDIQNLLKSNKLVLFTGTPCQIAGLKAYLKKDYENLLTIDLVCHGVPSPEFYKKYISELTLDKDEKVINTNFRDKIHGWNPNLIVTTTTNKKTISGPAQQDSYMRAFLENLSLRDSCFNCPFQNIPRQADITLGDYWGVSRYKESLDDSKGTSLIFINNGKGEKYINTIKNECIFFEETPLEYALKCNPCLYKPVEEPVQNRKLFLDLLSKGSTFKDAVDVCANDHCDYVISNFWWSGSNYGAVLTAFALQQYLLELGLTSKLLNTGETRRFDNYNDTCFCKFAKEFLNISKEYSNRELKKLAKHIKGAIVGSDQVFRMEYILSLHFSQYLQNFLRRNNRKIAISRSFGYGLDEFKTIALNKPLFKKVRNALRSFDYISVREISGKKIFEEEFKLNADFILDPVFLVTPKAYEQIINKSTVQGDCIVSYVLDENEDYKKAYSYLTQQLNTNIVNIDACKAEIPVEDWLAYIKNCKLLITDSFHGVCFAIIFNRPFICVKNKDRGTSRFDTLIKTLKLDKQFITSIEDIYNLNILQNIDYDNINNILLTELKRCRKTISDVLLNNYSNNQYAHINKILNDIKNILPKCFLQKCRYKILSKLLPSKKEYYKSKLRKLKDKLAWM